MNPYDYFDSQYELSEDFDEERETPPEHGPLCMCINCLPWPEPEPYLEDDIPF